MREGDTLVITKIDRLARSARDLHNIVHDLEQRSISLKVLDQDIDTRTPHGKAFLGMMATFAEFESDLIRMRTREGMAVARAKGKLRGKQPKLSPKQQTELKRMHETGDYSISDLAEVFSVSRATVYRTLAK